MTRETAVEDVRRLRDSGLSWAAIERALGWPDTHGNKPWRLLRGGGHAGQPEAKYSTISLWKAVDGGRSFRAVEAMLAAHGISCSKGEKSEWEGRYEIEVAEEDRERAEDLLFRPVDEWQVQILDNLNDHTK
jgi:hypothetical protein